jgi:hypothetical protein
MNFKSITTLGLVAVALAVTSLAPAQASNTNNKALNQLAMQYYMQNQSGRGNLAYNPLIGNATAYSNILPANYTYGATPWTAGALNGYGVAQTPWSAGCTGTTSTAYNGYNSAYGNILAPQYNSIAAQIANLQARLATTNPNSWTALKLQNKINSLQRQENALASSGYGSAYAYRPGVWSNLRGTLGL